MKTQTEIEIIGALALFLLEKTGSIFGEFDGRLTADEQRRHFDCVPFGKCRMCISGEDETVTVSRKVCFGQDFELTRKTWAEMERDIRNGIHPFSLGRYSRKYTTI
jgi:hypothetical protein